MELSPRRTLLLSLAVVLSTAVACSASKDESGDGDGSGASAGDGDAAHNGDGAGNGNGSGNGDGDIDVNAAGDGDGDKNPGPVCDSYQAESERVEPAVLLLLDQSGSMAEPRWSHAKEAVITASANLENFAQVGFIGFPTHPISSDSVYAESCGASLKVAPGGAGTSAAIAASIHSTAPYTGHTPVRAALELAGSEFAKPQYATKARYVVLITDGQPNCASSSVGQFWQTEDPSDAVATLLQQGVTTFVVGYDLPPAGIEPANNMAIAGGTESFKNVADGVALSAELDLIRQQIIPCDFQLNEPPRGGATYVRVTIDDTDYALNEAWTLEGEVTVVLTEGAAACNVLRDGATHNVSIEVECEPVVVR